MPFLTVKEVAKRLCHSEQTVRNLIARGELECYRCPGVRISEEQLAAYLSQAQRVPPATSSPRRVQPQPIQHLNADRLLSAWKEQGVD